MPPLLPHSLWLVPPSVPPVATVRPGSEGSGAAGETMLEWWEESVKCLGTGGTRKDNRMLLYLNVENASQ